MASALDVQIFHLLRNLVNVGNVVSTCSHPNGLFGFLIFVIDGCGIGGGGGGGVRHGVAVDPCVEGLVDGFGFWDGTVNIMVVVGSCFAGGA